MNILIRNMIESDKITLHKGFKQQGWNKSIELFDQYYNEQQNGIRKIFIAVCDNYILGYATLIDKYQNGPFVRKNIPVICDFNVFQKYQRNGIGSFLLNYIEDTVKKYSDEIALAVGLHYGYGAAQRLYIKRGYIPDGSGVWYNNTILEQYEPCVNDDNLVLYLSKKLI